MKNIIHPQGHMLDPCAPVVVDVLLNLRLPLPCCWFVDGHLHLVSGVCHDDGAKGGVFGVDLFVVHTPEAVEAEDLFVPIDCRHHLVVGLIADDVVDVKELGDGDEGGEGVDDGAGDVTGEEDPLIAVALDEGVSDVAVGLNGSEDHVAVRVLEAEGRLDGLGATLNGSCVDISTRGDSKGDVLHCVSLDGDATGHLRLDGVERGGECEDDFVLLNDVSDDVSTARLEASISDGTEAEAANVVGGGLLSIGHPEMEMVVASEGSHGGGRERRREKEEGRFEWSFKLDDPGIERGRTRCGEEVVRFNKIIQRGR